MMPSPAFAEVLINDLTALWTRAPECRLVAYCDLETRLVLRHVADPSIRQEVLDQLSEEAHAAFLLRQSVRLALPPALAAPFANAAEPTAPEGLRLIDDQGVRLFLRSACTPQDALILLCKTPDCADALLPEAERVLVSLRAAGSAALAGSA